MIPQVIPSIQLFHNNAITKYFNAYYYFYHIRNITLHSLDINHVEEFRVDRTNFKNLVMAIITINFFKLLADFCQARNITFI